MRGNEFLDKMELIPPMLKRQMSSPKRNALGSDGVQWQLALA